MNDFLQDAIFDLGFNAADKMPVMGLSVGMRVVGLDRPWGQDGAPTESFTISSRREIDALRGVVQYVFVEREEPTGSQLELRRDAKRVSEAHRAARACGRNAEEAELLDWDIGAGRIF